ncbi:MAG: hypothetical protein HZA54_12135 [Planctomycetes bacterium]|nr:hypothetical protein [Planctomycetota bacterium]
MTALTWESALPLGLVLLLAGGVGAAVGLSYALTRRVCPAPMRRLLGGLRLAALALAVVCLVGPSSAGGERKEEKPPLTVLVDCSRSMAIGDESEGRTRCAAAAATRAAERALFDRLAARYDVSFLGFGRRVTALPPGGPSASEEETQLGGALAEALSRVRGRRLAPVLLFSDGVNTGGRDPLSLARALAATRHPVHPVGLGGEAGAAVMDRRVRSLSMSSTALLHSTVPVRAELAFHGCRGQTVQVLLACDGKPAEARTVLVAADREQVRLEFTLKAEEQGQHRVTLEVEGDEREVDATNNRRTTFFFVGRTTLKLLYLEGGPRWEAKYLRRSLEGTEGIVVEMPRVGRAGAGGDGEGGAGGAAVVGGLPDPASLGSYHAIVLGDVSAAALGREFMQGLRTAVDQAGTGLLMIGGLGNFGAGGYAGTPVGELLPVRVAAGDGQRKGIAPLARGRAAPGDFLLSLAEGDTPSAEAWGNLPALDGGVEFGALKPGGTVLLETAGGRPVLVAQPFGRGRVAAFGADTTWRWVLADAGGAEVHRRFWRQVVLWLARQDQRGERNFWLALDRFQFAPGDVVDAAAWLVGSGDRPVAGAQVEAVLDGPGGARPVALREAEGAWRARLAPEEPGEYVLSARAQPPNGPPVSDSVRFVVAGADAELDDPAPDHEALRAIAEITGGRFLRPADVRAFLEELAGRDERNVVERRRIRPLWDNLPVLLLFAALLSAEWVLRRTQRLP